MSDELRRLPPAHGAHVHRRRRGRLLEWRRIALVVCATRSILRSRRHDRLVSRGAGLPDGSGDTDMTSRAWPRTPAPLAHVVLPRLSSSVTRSGSTRIRGSGPEQHSALQWTRHTAFSEGGQGPSTHGTIRRLMRARSLSCPTMRHCGHLSEHASDNLGASTQARFLLPRGHQG